MVTISSGVAISTMIIGFSLGLLLGNLPRVLRSTKLWPILAWLFIFGGVFVWMVIVGYIGIMQRSGRW